MRLLDCYCGVGGFSAGAIQAGCEVVLGVDNDESPLMTFAANCDATTICATLGSDVIGWPEPEPDLHIHMVRPRPPEPSSSIRSSFADPHFPRAQSPPCQSLSKARAGTVSAADLAQGIDAVRWCVNLVLEKGYTSWSLENVATPPVKKVLAELARRHPKHVAFLVVNAADYGVASNRVRLIASTPEVIRGLKQVPVKRLSVADAFEMAGQGLPSSRDLCFVKSNTTNRDGSACIRSVRCTPLPLSLASPPPPHRPGAFRQVEQPSFCVTASHPLIFCSREGRTLRCLTRKEHAILMGFPPDWRLPTGARRAQKAVGNAVRASPLCAPLLRGPLRHPHPFPCPLGHLQVPPPLARAVMEAAWRVARARNGAVPPPPPAPPDSPVLPPPCEEDDEEPEEVRVKLRRIERRLESLEAAALRG